MENTRAKQHFKNHVAKVVIDTGELFILEWKNASGSSEYEVRYTLDIPHGDLFITGDLGSAVAKWYNEMTPEKLYGCLNDPGYFADKCVCATDKFTFLEDDIEEDLLEIRERIRKEVKEDDADKLNSDFLFIEIMLSSPGVMIALSAGGGYPYNVEETIKHYEKTYNVSFRKVGKRLDPRVSLWTEGYRMAMDQFKNF